MNRLWLLIIGMFILGGVLFYWVGEDGSKVPGFRKLDTIEKQISYTGGLVTALNLGYNGPRKEVEELEDIVIKSTEYMLNNFKDELEQRPTLHVRILQDVAYQYGEYKQNFDKSEKYRQKYEKLAEKNKTAFTPERYRSIQLGALQARSSMYFDKKEYEKVVDVSLEIIEKFPYSFQEHSRTNLWIDAYESIWNMYNDRIKDYDKALYYAKAMAIDPRKLPKEKIGWLGDQGKDYTVSYNRLLEIEAESNKRKSDYNIQITYGSFGKHKEIQQLLVDDLRREENEYNCASYTGIGGIRDLYNQYEKYGVLVSYNYINICIFYHEDSKFGYAVKIGDKKYRYTEIFSRLTFPNYVEFLQDGEVKVLTESMLEEINGTNRQYKRPEVTKEELTKGWKRTVRVIDDKELKRLFKRVQ